jgi:hypothetical protein
MRLIDIQPTSGEKFFVNPAFITSAGENHGTVTVTISESPAGPHSQRQVRGSLEELVARINAALDRK